MALRLYLLFPLLFFFLSNLFAQSNDAKLIHQETHITLKNRRLITTHYFEIKINNRNGEKHAKISIPYSPLVDVRKINAYVSDANNNKIKELKKKQITQRNLNPDEAFYSDIKVKEFSLRHNQYPFKLVYSYEEHTVAFLHLTNWRPVIDIGVPTSSALLTVELPEDFRFNYTANLIAPPTIENNEGTITYQWTATYDGEAKRQALSPRLHDYIPSVKIVPDHFSYHKNGSFTSWSDYGNWQHGLIRDGGKLPDHETATIHKIVEGMADEKEIIRSLYHHLQDNTRYINVEIETGGMKPYPPGYVSEKKYGDCKALTNYFKSVLKSVGIQSYYTNIFAGTPGMPINRDFPSQQFNHVILYVPLEKDTLWLDCTSKGPFNYAGTFNQGRYALVIDENNSHFVQTPAMKPLDVLDSRLINIEYLHDKSTTIDLAGTYRGYQFEYLSELDKIKSGTVQAKYMREKFLYGHYELLNATINRLHRDTTWIGINLKASTKMLYQHFGNEILAKNFPAFKLKLEPPASRTMPVQLDYPIYKSDTLLYAIPQGFKPRIVMDNLAIETKYGSYSIEMFEQEESIKVIKNILINNGYYTLEEYKDFYGFIDLVLTTENSTLFILNPIH